MEGGEAEAGTGTAEQFLHEAFCFVFKDEFTQFTTSITNAFNSTIQSSTESK